MRRKHKRHEQVITEFLVQVHRRTVDWGGVDSFLLWLLRKRPREGFLPHAWKIARIKRHQR